MDGRDEAREFDLLPKLAAAQSAFYVATGVWPLVAYRAFVSVTGPKKDDWLVKSVGLLITVVGVIIGLGAAGRRAQPELTLLATSSAAALTAIDVAYVSRGRISRVYLLDAVAEIALIAAWGYAWLLRSGSKSGQAAGRA